MWNNQINALKQQYQHKEIYAEADANCFVVESKGMTQIRGNGFLLLTSQELLFRMFVPVKDIIIPLTSIRKIDIVTWHLGKSVFQPLLKVYFKNKKGAQDSVAWWIENPEDWKLLLNQLTS